MANVRDRPILIHVTGPSGSGKSTLADKLNKKGIVAIDTDDFVQGNKLEVIRNAKNEDERNDVRDRYFKMGFEEAIKNNARERVLVFVGILDHGSWNGKYYEGQQFDAKYYLDVDMVTLMEQYYKRIVSDMGDDKILWGKVANGNINFMGSKNLVRHGADMAQKYRGLRYAFVSASQILEGIESFKQTALLNIMLW